MFFHHFVSFCELFFPFIFAYYQEIGCAQLLCMSVHIYMFCFMTLNTNYMLVTRTVLDKAVALTIPLNNVKRRHIVIVVSSL